MVEAQTRPLLQVITPVFNEELIIESFYRETMAVLSRMEDEFRVSILFVIDPCTDRTFEILSDLAQQDPRVQVLLLANRAGHQMSVIAGVDHSDADAIVIMDSDLQHPPTVIPELVEQYRQGFDVVYTVRKEARDPSILKRLASRLFYWLMGVVSDVNLAQGQSDFRLISRRIANIFRHQIRERNQFLRGLFSWIGHAQTSVAFEARDRAKGESKYGLTQMIRLAFSGITSFSKRPLLYASSVGVFFSVLAFLQACFVFYEYIFSERAPEGWATLAILVSLLGGIQLIFLGIFGEYLGIVFDEVKARPLYLVDKAVNLEPPNHRHK